ncbi:AAA family ATPase [Lapidilactobacillus luobeiensis]|uniref:AAA family ATPase n=1 Tax=Lapidilactobacillus luobeiensis TaxID=2950371 RepID=UPI0021C4289F|nr:AAA family ATPase [Lapidilactobacillus luobeiensis]
MISENYGKLLEKQAIEIDRRTAHKFDLSKLAHEITADKNDEVALELISTLGKIKSTESYPQQWQTEQEIIESLYKYLGASQVDDYFLALKSSSNMTLSQSLHELDELVGLPLVKQQVRDLIAFNQIQQLRVKNGLKKTNKTLHMVFLGNPGTAKTTVARIVGRMYKSIGLLSKGQFIEASRTDLIAEYQGQTAIKVRKLINRARGGVLFIDEAYSITENDHGDSYGRECLTELTKALKDYRDDLVVIVAGYTDLMTDFFESNPGLKSRFNTFITFDDYSLDELTGIFKFQCQQYDYRASEQVIAEVRQYLQAQLAHKDEYFSNGRLVRNLFDDITMNQAKRLANQPTEEIKAEDLMNLLPIDVLTISQDTSSIKANEPVV